MYGRWWGEHSNDSPTKAIRYSTTHESTSRYHQNEFLSFLRKPNTHTFKINAEVESMLVYTPFRRVIEMNLPFSSFHLHNYSRHPSKILSVTVTDTTNTMGDVLKTNDCRGIYAVVASIIQPHERTVIQFLLTDTFTVLLSTEDDTFLELHQHIKPLIHNVVDFLGNFLNFINCRECILIESDSTKIPKHMRSRGISAPPKGTTIVAITDKLVRYLNTARSNSKHKELDISFWVRGHWRRLQAPCWTHKQGQLTWVHPYIKGEGVLHKHDYKLRKLRGVDSDANTVRDL